MRHHTDTADGKYLYSAKQLHDTDDEREESPRESWVREEKTVF